MTFSISLFDFCNANREFWKRTLKEVFPSSKWIEPFFDSSHHGFTHGNKVRNGCLELIKTLSYEEKSELFEEGKMINKINPLQSAIAIIEIAAILHDCGRFNDSGKIVKEDQKVHHIIGAKRGEYFCKKLGFENESFFVKNAILHHDFKSEESTPNMMPPKTIISKIVQASDQLDWFCPTSIERTLNYSKEFNIIFFDPELKIETRLDPVSNKNLEKDTVTQLLFQLYGPYSEKRFGIKVAKEKVKNYKGELKNSILKLSEENNCKNSVEELIKEYENRSSDAYFPYV